MKKEDIMTLTTQKILIAVAMVYLTLGATLSVATVPSLETAGSYGAIGADGTVKELVQYKDGTEKELVRYLQGGQLSNAGNYEWWYGCSPTSVGGMMGYYDRNGYAGDSYDNLVPGGLAETNTFGPGSNLVDSVIASQGHQWDFYSAKTYGYNTGGGTGNGYGLEGDDRPPPYHAFDCLADFMGTSQDNIGTFGPNPNGATGFWYYGDNSPLYESEIFAAGPDYYNSSGMYGIGEYLEYAGYDADVLYNQPIYGYGGIPAGFTFDQYKAEIDAGRPVLIHIEGHSMLGYGYNEGTNIINVFDTWVPNGQNPGTMTWGGDYSGLAHYAVTVLEPVPEPTTFLLLVMGGVGLLRHRRR
jgi:hypothetical protein